MAASRLLRSFHGGDAVSEPVEFPVPPDEVRFIRRAERSRSPPPPLAQARDPPARSPASVAAGHLLRGYIRRPEAPRKVREKRQLPTRFVAVASLMMAAALIPLGLIYFLTCRPELRGRRLRARLISPGDVRRVVFLRSLPVTTLLNRFRM